MKVRVGNLRIVSTARVFGIEFGTYQECAFADNRLFLRMWHLNFAHFSGHLYYSCYYKTHIQNAKKRLRTMVRNPTKRANARHLCEHLDLIEKHKVASELGGTNESPQPKRKKQRGDDDDHPTIQKDQKLAAKSTSDAGTSLRHGFTGGNVASDCEIRDNSSIASAQHTPTAEIEDKETPTMTVDPWVTPKESHGHESVEGITTPRPSTRSSTRQSANVANGTRRSKKMMTPPLSPLLI